MTLNSRYSANCNDDSQNIRSVFLKSVCSLYYLTWNSVCCPVVNCKICIRLVAHTANVSCHGFCGMKLYSPWMGG